MSFQQDVDWGSSGAQEGPGGRHGSKENGEERVSCGSGSVDLSVVVMEGWMDKCGQNLVMSKWTHRWCVLKGNSFVYYVDDTKAVQKGSYAIDDTCKIVTEGDKKKCGGRNYVISLQKPNSIGGGGYELLLSCDDHDLLRVWESAISGVIATLRQIREVEGVQKKNHAPRLSVILDTIMDATNSVSSSSTTDEGSASVIGTESKIEKIKRNNDKRPSFFRRRSTLRSKSFINDSDIDISEVVNSTVIDGRLRKRDNGESEYTSEHCVLTNKSLMFFSDNHLRECRGAVLFDSSYYLTRLTTDKKIKTTNDLYLLSLHTRGSGKNFITKTSEVLLSFSDEGMLKLWEEKIYNVLYKFWEQTSDVIVKVTRFNDAHDIVAQIEEPVYKISLLVSSVPVLEQYHHYIDVREVYSKLKPISSGIITATFPRYHKRSAFNIQLNEDEIENRVIGLQNWLQDFVNKYSRFDYLNFIGEINDVQMDIALIFGASPQTLKYFMKKARDEKAKPSHAPPLPNKSKVMSLFEKYADDEEDGNIDTNNNGFPNQEIYDKDAVCRIRDDDLRMPSSPDKLALYNVRQLALLCKVHQMDCRDFKGKKDYITALSSTYQKAPPYLHNKEARPIVENIVQTLEHRPSSINDHALNIEIDKIFIDLMRKLDVAEGLLGVMSMEYNTLEKLDRIRACVSVWDRELYLTGEDKLLLFRFSSERVLDSFSVLNLISRIQRSAAEGSHVWLHRWCALRGVPALIASIDCIIEQEPLLEVDAVHLLKFVEIFRAIMESDCRYEVVGTRGAIEALVKTILFDYKPLAFESLSLLSEIILFGGTQAVWQVISGFKHLAQVKNDSFLKILVDGILEQDITIQCPILSLINSILLYEADINTRIKIRSCLHKLHFEDICGIFKKEYSRMSKASQAIDTSGVTSDDQIRDRIDKLFFGGTRFQKKSDAKVDDTNDVDYYEDDCRNLQLRPGVEIKEFDFGPSVAEDFDSGIHPEMGIMEGHMVAISKKSDEDDGQSWEGVVKKVAKRLSFTDTKPVEPPDDVNKYLRSWYELHDNILSWFNLADKTDGYRERSGTLDVSRVVDILDFSSITSKVKVPLHNMFSLVLCDQEDHIHLYVDSVETKLKWILAIRVIQKRTSLRKCAYRFSPSRPLESTATLKLQKDFVSLISIYESVAKEDVATMYGTTIADIMELGENSKSHDPVELMRFIDFEMRKHRNIAKLQHILSDIAQFVNENYAPQEEIPEEIEEDEVKIIHPLAVPDSDRPIPKAPPMPFIPANKEPRIPNKKVKQLFWTKVKPVNVWKSIWEGMEEPELAWVTLDEQFGEIVRRRKAITGKTGVSPDKNPKAISLFDGKRTQNAAIACGKLRKSPEEIFDMIVTLDPEELTQEINETILNLLLPTDEEIAALRAYTGDVENLDFCGRLFSYLTEIERLEQRLQVQNIMLTWNSEASVIFDQINIIKLSLQEINDTESLTSFEMLLSCILAAGNYMNGKSNRGQAHGFKLDILTKLRNIKQVGFGKKTFLHFIVGQFRSHFPDLCPFYEKWNFMWKSPKVILKNLEKIMVELQDKLDKCINEIEAIESIESEQCRIPLFESLSAFISQASTTYQELDQLFDSVDKDVRTCKKYFGETSIAAVLTSQDDDPWCSFFSLLVNFANMHRLASVELEEWDKAEERIKKNAMARKAKLAVERTKKTPRKQNRMQSTDAFYDADNIALSQMIAKERKTFAENDATPARERRSSSEGNMIDVFKKKMLMIRKTADGKNDEGDSDDSDDGAW